jgi:hypothetical protein
MYAPTAIRPFRRTGRASPSIGVLAASFIPLARPSLDDDALAERLRASAESTDPWRTSAEPEASSAENRLLAALELAA